MRRLTADEIECRIAQISTKGISLLLYKTARTDSRLLDETFGPMNWTNDFYTIEETLYCKIGVWDEDKKCFIYKSDCGTESNMEAEKGRASDCFKRAGFKWGIGIELYTAPNIWVSPDNCEIFDKKCRDRFDVQEIGYDDQGTINKLRIYNISQRKVAFEFGYNKKEKFSEVKKESQEIVKIKKERGTITADQVDELDKLLSIKDVDIKMFFDFFKIGSLNDMKVEDYSKAIAMIKKKADK